MKLSLFLINVQQKQANRNPIDESFVIDTHVQFNQSCEFDKCTFKIVDGGKLEITAGIFNDCVFISETNNAELTVSSVVYNSAIIKGVYYRIQLNNLKSCIKLNDDSNCRIFGVKQTKLEQPFIRGECDHLSVDRSSAISLNSENLFMSTKSTWLKKVSTTIICTDFVVQNVEIDPYYFATKCIDKSSLDIGGAIFIDKWSELRKKYTGIGLIIVFVLTLIFFLPLITKYYLLMIASKIPDLSIEHLHKIPLWKVILYGGKEGCMKVLYSVLTIILFIYNSLRLYLTICVSKLREEEKLLSDANFSIIRINPDKYSYYVKLHNSLNLIFYVVLFYSFLKIYDALMFNVIDPNSLNF